MFATLKDREIDEQVCRKELDMKLRDVPTKARPSLESEGNELGEENNAYIHGTRR